MKLLIDEYLSPDLVRLARELDRDADLVNQVLDVSLRSDEIHVLRYGLPL